MPAGHEVVQPTGSHFVEPIFGREPAGQSSGVTCSMQKPRGSATNPAAHSAGGAMAAGGVDVASSSPQAAH